MNVIYFLAVILPAGLLGWSVYASVKKFRIGTAPRRAMKTNLTTFLALVLLICGFAFAVSAAENDGEAAPADSAVQQEAESEASSDSVAKGMGLLAAGLVTGLAGIGGGIAVAAGAPAAIGATSEDPKIFGRALIFVALGESIALYGVIISILILNQV
ncbi:MAG: ATP synthase subunit C [Clostridiales bacterium]|nr:ATP synthase subunit C [Clostridiales bacterium]